MGWHLTDPQLRIAPTISSEDLVAERIREADAMVHLVAINLEDELKPRATAEGPASAEAGSVGAEEEEEAAAEVAVVAEVVEAAVAVVVAEAADDASWRLGPKSSS
jgi:hypothetical protein